MPFMCDAVERRGDGLFLRRFLGCCGFESRVALVFAATDAVRSALRRENAAGLLRGISAVRRCGVRVCRA